MQIFAYTPANRSSSTCLDRPYPFQSPDRVGFQYIKKAKQEKTQTKIEPVAAIDTGSTTARLFHQSRLRQGLFFKSSGAFLGRPYGQEDEKEKDVSAGQGGR